jgi:streptomycin 6-kinase
MADTGLTHDAWLELVPELVTCWCEEWALTPGLAYPPGAAGHAVRVDRSDGTPAVLKLIYPHRESEHEADALALWDGDGAVRLLERSEDGYTVLLERCEPGTVLADEGQEVALDVLIALLPRLWKPAGEPFHTLASEAAWWATYLEEQWDRIRPPYPRALLEAALVACDELPGTQGESVLLHQDLHGENVLAAQRERWLVIDPKPLVGEREFAVAPIVRSFELGCSRHDVLLRFDRLTGELGLDRERARGWAVGQTLAWAFNSHWRENHLNTAQWLLEAA